MGGQACILYGAAEFSRDVDLAVAVDPRNLTRLKVALAELGAESVYFPPLSADTLARGHASHFRCQAPGLEGIRVDVIAVMRGVDPFPRLWRRRMRVRLPGIGVIAVMGVADLVQAKKTQRDKDWPMIRRLVESDVARAAHQVPAQRVRFWLRECRTPELLIDLVRRFPRAAALEAGQRPALQAARTGRRDRVESALRREEERERKLDRRYWQPLRAELEQWRLAGRPARRSATAAAGAEADPAR